MALGSRVPGLRVSLWDGDKMVGERLRALRLTACVDAQMRGGAGLPVG